MTDGCEPTLYQPVTRDEVTGKILSYGPILPRGGGTSQCGQTVGAALVTQPVLGSIAAPRERAVPATLLTHVTQLTTAFLRNSHYHTRNDTAATLDYQRMARVVDGVFSAIINLLMLVPSAIYAAMFFAQRFPDSERKAAGVSTAAMYGELKRPLFLVVFICMWLTAATELGPGQWVSNIFNEVMHSTLQAGVLLLVWINGIMYALRQFGGGLAHRFSPVTLVAVTAPIAALGLWLFGRADTPVLAFAAAALLAIGTAFWWPTMLGLTSERFPRGGALALAMVGAAGAFSTAVAGPVMGWINNTYGATNVLPIWAVLPVLIALIFGILHLVDRARGGYRIERVGA